jgi:adenylate cyclase
MSEEPKANFPEEGRRLAAIVFTDIAGYSALMQRDETGTMALVRIDFDRMRALAAEHQGEVLKSLGDGLLLCFASVMQAVSYSLKIQEEFSTRPPGALLHRIGIHLGDVFHFDGDVTGDGVNLAARLQTKAQPGTICLSQSVFDAVKGKLQMEVKPLGRTHFKNIAEPIPIFLVWSGKEGRPRRVRSLRWVAVAGGAAILVGLAFFLWPGSQSSHPAPSEPGPNALAPAAVVDPKAIAVLPLENMSDDKNNAFFADGVHEDLLTDLSLVRDLHVVSRTSVMQYLNTTKSIRQIGQELGVAYVLEGSVRREGNKVRVTGQLVDARIDQHVWAKAYDRDLNDIFAIQGELAQAIADALQAVLTPETKALVARRPTENFAAYDDYLKAREIINAGAVQGDRTSIALLEEAVRLDPNFAQAWAELASQRAYISMTAAQTEDELTLANQAVENAVRIAPDDPAVIKGLGDYYYLGIRDYARATEEYMRLQQLWPNDAEATFSLGLIQRRQGRFAEAMANLRKGIRLDPTNRSYKQGLVEMLVATHNYDEALDSVREAARENPDDVGAAWAVARFVFLATGSTSEVEAFAPRTVDASMRSFYLYARASNAQVSGNWADFIRIDREQRYFDDNVRDPRWSQDTRAAEVFAESGDMVSARARAAEALSAMEQVLISQPKNATLWANMSLAHGILGEKEATLLCTSKSAELLPESRDTLIGPFNSVTCDLALAWGGVEDKALAEFERLLHVPFGLNIYQSRVSFRPLQNDPHFRELVADLKNNGPLH